MAHVIAIANQKGGVGKTTSAVNLSASLALLNKKILLIDIDPQGNATMGSGVDKHELNDSLCEVLLKKTTIENAIVQTSHQFDLLPTNSDLITAEVLLVTEQNKEFVLKDALAKIKHNYHFMIIDCPPSLNMLTINALSAADSIIIPMQCEYYALEGLSALVNTTEKIRQSINTKLRIMGLLRTMYDGRNNLSNEVSVQLLQHFPKQVFKTLIPRNVKLAEAPSFGSPISQYAKSSKGAMAYTALASEVLRKVRHL